MRVRFLLCSMVLMLALAASADMQATAQATHSEVLAKSLTWTEPDIPGFAKGLKLAGVNGDPNAAGQPYTIRLKFPAGYVFPAHYHPNAENLTVLSGTFLLGHGEKADDASMKTYAPGDFLYIPGKMPHYGKVRGETVVQLHGVGPFEIILVDKK